MTFQLWFICVLLTIVIALIIWVVILYDKIECDRVGRDMTEKLAK